MIKIRRADAVFSKWIKIRDKYTCQRCGAVHAVKSRGLHCAHFITRRNEATRFDPDNACALCYGCHSHFHQHPDEHRVFMEEQLGSDIFTDLTTVRRRAIVKKDDQAVIERYK